MCLPSTFVLRFLPIAGLPHGGPRDRDPKIPHQGKPPAPLRQRGPGNPPSILTSHASPNREHTNRSSLTAPHDNFRLAHGERLGPAASALFLPSHADRANQSEEKRSHETSTAHHDRCPNPPRARRPSRPKRPDPRRTRRTARKFNLQGHRPLHRPGRAQYRPRRTRPAPGRRRNRHRPDANTDTHGHPHAQPLSPPPPRRPNRPTSPSSAE